MNLIGKLDGSVLAYRDFRLLWAGQAISAIGSQFFPIAVALRVLEIGGGAADVGIVFGGRILAMVVFVLVGGVWADRLPRRSVMAMADLVRLVAVASVAVAPSGVGVWGLAGLTFVVGAGEAFFRPAYVGIVPSLVPDERLEAANAWKAAAESLSAVIGPAVGGVLVAFLGTTAVFAIDAATFGTSVLFVLAISDRPGGARDQGPIIAELARGLAVVRGTRWVRIVLIMTSLQTMIVVSSHLVVLPVVAEESLGGPSAYGLVLAVFAFSGLIGSVLVARRRFAQPGTVAIVCVSMFACAPFVLLTPVSVTWVAAGYFVAGSAMMPFNVLWESALQRQFRKELLGRVSSVEFLVSIGLLPVGLALVGPAIETFGRDPVLTVAAVVQVATSLIALLFADVRRFHTGAPEPDVTAGALGEA